MRTATVLTLLTVLFATSTGSPRAQGASAGHKPVALRLDKRAVSPALRGLKAGVPSRANPKTIPNFTRAFPGRFDRTASMDPARQTAAVPSGLNVATPNPTLSFEGLSDQDNENFVGFRVVPPDTQGEVGPNHYIQMTNLVFAVYDKAGNLLFGPAPNNIFWTGFGGVCETNNDGDPIVLYDQAADRWVVSQLGIGEFSPFIGEADGHQCFAVSRTNDPLGEYNLYDFVVSPSQDGGFFYFAINDYPKLGVWPDAYYGTINEFQCFALTGECDFIGAVALAFERDRMLAGLSPSGLKVTLPPGANEVFFSLQPSNWIGSTPPPNGRPNTFLMAFDDESFGSAPGPGPDGYRLWDFAVNWTAPLTSTFTALGQVNTPDFDSNLCDGAACVPQPAGGEALDSLGQFTMYPLIYRNFGSHQTLVGNHTVDVDGNNLAGVRWFELRDAGAGWFLQQTGTYAPNDGDHRWMGSAAMDGSGNIAVGFSVSGAATFPSIRYASRVASDAPNVLSGGEAECQAGAGAQIASMGRWGDYSRIAVDPSDDCTFWLTSEYYQATADFDFHTRVCTFSLPGCGGPGCVPTENPEVSCSDGVDNDCDGLIDAADPDCGPVCVPNEPVEASCSDGVDNDCDGLTDGADPDCSPPNPPSGLIATPGSSGAGRNKTVFVVLNWVDESANETSFIVERGLETGKGRTKTCGGFAPLGAPLAANTTSYLDSDVANSTTYCYRVKAGNAVGESAYSNVATAKTAK